MLVLDGRMSLGTLYAFYVYLDMLIYPMTDLPNLFVTARQAFVSIDREEEILRAAVAVRREGRRPVAGPLGKAALRGVTFRYREDLPPALRDVSLLVEPGRRVAVVGPVASGKSTLLRLLAGLLPAQEGAYEIDGRAFEDLDWTQVRARIGYVPQESHLVSETIEENVAFGRAAEPEWIERCLEIAQMGPDVAAMPDGTRTQLGQRGTLVSGGQKQRIAIARALAGRPDLLLLDDCTASLDARNEDRFWSALDSGFPHLTVVLVSHRLATILRADRIAVLDHGGLADTGTHEELAARCSVYRRFLMAEQRKSHLAGEPA
jgi:ATP-binding cassette subfamily B protein